jgi:hypothetical protein
MLLRPGWYRFQNPVWSRRNRLKVPAVLLDTKHIGLAQESDAGLDRGVFAFRCRLLSRRADCLPRTRAPKAYPPVGDGLKQSLLGLRQRLSETSTSAVFATTEQRGSEELKAWSDSAAHYYHDSAEEIKTLLLEVA